MTLEQLICFKRTNAKLIVTEMNPETLEQMRIFEGYETDICDQLNEDFDKFYEENKNRLVINFGAILDRNNLPAVNILIYA